MPTPHPKKAPAASSPSSPPPRQAASTLSTPSQDKPHNLDELLQKHPYIVLFDGVCNLCNGSVHFIVDRDKAARFSFAPLQSPLGQQLCTRFGLPTQHYDSLVLIEHGKIFLRSTSALRIARRLRFPWFLLAAGLILPRFLRDPFYNLIARNRYRWFGKEESCRIPTPDLRKRFLDG
jgi:predicted DCC family thiol-disulfide oxidoreductase YuxK